MDNILINIISVVVTSVVIPLIGVAGTALIRWLNTKIKNEKASKLLTQATDIVLNAVKSVFQTYVESLKKNGSFTAEAQIEAFNKAKELVLNQLSDEVLTFIGENFGSVDDWLRTQIESTIDSLKNKLVN